MIENESNKPQDKKQDNPSTSKTHYDAVFWVCIAQIGGVYCAQQTPTLHDYIKEFFEQDYGDKFEFYFNISQTISLGFLVFLQGFIGMLCDLYSGGLVILVQAFVVVFGQFLILASIYLNHFWLFFIGRIFIVLAVQTILTSSKIYLNSFLSDGNKGFLLGLQSSIVVGIKFLNLILDPIQVSNYGMMTPIMVAFIIASISFIAANFCLVIEVRIKKQQQLEITLATQLINTEVQQYPLQQQQQQQSSSQWQQIMEFDRNFWFYCFIISSSLLISNIFDTLLPAYLSSHWKLDTNTATQIASIITIYGFINWLMGIVLDCLNKDYEWLIFASISTTVGLVILTTSNPIIGSIIAGLGYNMRVVVMIPLLNKLVQKKSLGKAYGLIRSSKDFLAMISFFLISIVVQKTQSYQSTFQVANYLSIIICIVSIMLFQMKKQ